MDTFFAEYLARLDWLHGAIKEAIAGLSAEALAWVPGPEMNAIAVLVTHLAGAERYWIGDVAGQEPSNRDRDSEFTASGLDEAALIARLDAALAHSQSVVARLALDDLATEQVSTRHQQPYSVAWALLHALDHGALHLGHIEITRQLWLQRNAATD